MLLVSDDWKNSYPGAAAGILVMRHVTNPPQHPNFEHRKRELEGEVRARFASHDGGALRRLDRIQPYADFFKRFGKTYHVLLQLESVALRGKPIPGVATLVEAMFVAELKNLLLTAGHDLAAVRGQVRLDVARGHERYLKLNGQEQGLKPGDMMMADDEGVISSVIYGPDHRTRIAPDTRDVLFAVYAPPGIGEAAVRRHLDDIRENVLLFAPEALVETLQVHVA